MRSILSKLVVVCAVTLAPLGLFTHSVFAQDSADPTPAVEENTASKFDHGRVYLLRGLANIFSRGMDTLGEKLGARGVDAVVINYIHGFDIADELIEAYQTDPSILPIIIIGHSLGGNRALSMSVPLAENNVPVRLIVIFDATVPWQVPLNVEEVLNLHMPEGACMWESCTGVKVLGAPGYTGIIDNKDVSDLPDIGHISIDKSAILHEEVIEKVLSVLAEK
jgi:hypothetical protein